MLSTPTCIFQRRTTHPNEQKLSGSRWNAIGPLTSDLSLVFHWSTTHRILFNASKTESLQLSTRHNLQDNYLVLFNETLLPLSSTLNTLGQFFPKNFNWQFHSSTLAKLVSKKLGVLWRLRPFCSPSKLLALYRDLIRPFIKYGSHIWEDSNHTLYRMESKVFRVINSPPLTNCLDYLSYLRNVASLSIFYCYVHADCSSELADCMPPPLPRLRCTSLSTFFFIYILSIFLMQELTSIFTLSSLTLVNSGTRFLYLFFHLPMT